MSTIYRNFRTMGAARSFVNAQISNVKAHAEASPTGGFTPVALLRSDQGFLFSRLEERGIKCILDKETERHISEAMLQAGAAVLKDRVQPECGDGWALETARAVYKAMESAR